MDPWAPINGISLERYAELSAEVTDTQDPEKQAEIVLALGVQRADWEAAKTGWLARMQDMSLMGQVATRYVPLYNAALTKKNGGNTTQVSFEDYVAMSGAVPVIGFEGMCAHYNITSNQWTSIATHWNQTIPTNPQYMQFGMLVQNESARIRAGGQPKPVNITTGPAPGGAGAIAATAQSPGGQPPGAMPGMAPGAMPGMAAPGMNPYMQANPYAAQQQAAMAANPYYQQQAYNNAQAANVGAQMGSAFNAFGSAVGSFVDGAVGAFAIGARVMVRWNDGNRYPGTVTASQAGQVQVAFPDGRQVWVPQAYVSI